MMTSTLPPTRRCKLLIFIVAYHAETTIIGVFKRIPAELTTQYDVEVLIIDDASADKTFEVAQAFKETGVFPFKLRVLFNPVNQGYGGNQKIGYHYAIENGFDYVALLHGDGQYAPECMPELVAPLHEGLADAVFGSRMMTRGAARKGGMPLYKFVGNRILSGVENKLLRSNLSEFHSGYRVYSVKALARVPFDLNTNDFHFDTEIIIQFLTAGLRIRELPIPTYYGNEICRVNGMKYALAVCIAALKARAQELGVLYTLNFDCKPSGNEQYRPKLDYQSPHSEVLKKVKRGSRVLDLGCAGGYVAQHLRQNLDCEVTGVDFFPLPNGVVLDEFIQHDLNAGLPDVDFRKFDYVLLLDVIEHLAAPEAFVASLYQALGVSSRTKLIVSSANIGFIVPRLMLACGQFNYGKRGILDMTHTRLFTFATLRRLFVQRGFVVDDTVGIPGPFPLALGSNWFSRSLVAVNQFFIRISKGIFAYQAFFVMHARPSLAFLLAHAESESAERSSRAR
jgi:glycosyltransferase involved in cell wall biosynthesis